MPTEEQIRQDQAQRLHFLSALYDRERAGQEFPTINAIAEDIGMPKTNFEKGPLRQLVDILERDGVISGMRTAHGLARVQLTAYGRQVVESKFVGKEPPGGSPSSIGDVHINGDGVIVNLAQNSPGAQQTATITADFARVREWVNEVRERASELGLDDDDRDELDRSIDVLGAELAKPTPNKERVRRSVTYLLAILQGTATSGLGSALIAGGEALFS